VSLFEDDIEFAVRGRFEVNNAFKVHDGRPLNANEALRIKFFRKLSERSSIKKLLPATWRVT